MGTVIERIELLLTSSAKGAIAGLKETEAASTSMDKSAGKLGTAFDKLGISGATALKVGVAGGAVAAGVAVAKFALDGIQKFSDLTAQTRSLRNVMGGTAEDASRIAGAARLLGLDVDTVGKGFFQLTKRIADNKDTLAQNGIQIARNNDGSVNMAKTLVNVSEGYNKIVDPAEKNLFLMQNFGKAGTALIPLLAQGADKLAAFYAQTAKHGEVFSEEDLQKGKEYKLAVNDLNQAWEGMSVSLGREVIPALTWMVNFFDYFVSTEIPAVVGAIGDVVDAFGHIPGVTGLVEGIGDAIDELGIGGGDKLKVVGYEVQNVAEQFRGLDAARAGEAFKRINDEAAKSPLAVGRTKQALLDFVQIAREDVGAGALIIQSLKDQGVNTDVYERALRNIAGKKLDDIQNTQAQKDAEVLLAGTYDQQIAKLDELANALLGKTDKEFAATNAVLQTNRAIEDYNTATADGSSTTDDLIGKLTGAESAAVHAAAALGANAEAQDTSGNATIAHNASIDAQIGYLQGVANSLAPDSPLRVYLEQYIPRLEATRGGFLATIDADTGPADAKITALMQRLGGTGLYGTGPGGPNPNAPYDPVTNPNGGGLYGTGPGMPPVGTAGYYGNPDPAAALSRFLGGTGDPSLDRFLAGLSGRASGGPVSAGSMYHVNELGMEYFRPTVDGTIIPLGASTATGGIDKSVSIGQMTVVSPNPLQTPRRIMQGIRDEQWKSNVP